MKITTEIIEAAKNGNKEAENACMVAIHKIARDVAFGILKGQARQDAEDIAQEFTLRRTGAIIKHAPADPDHFRTYVRATMKRDKEANIYALSDELGGHGVTLTRAERRRLRTLAAIKNQHPGTTEEELVTLLAGALLKAEKADEADEAAKARALANAQAAVEYDAIHWTSLTIAGDANEDGLEAEIADEADTAADAFSSELRDAIAALPAEQRRALNLYYFSDTTEEAAARQLNISRSKFHRLRLKAEAALKQRLSA